MNKFRILNLKLKRQLSLWMLDMEFCVNSLCLMEPREFQHPLEINQHNLLFLLLAKPCIHLQPVEDNRKKNEIKLKRDNWMQMEII